MGMRILALVLGIALGVGLVAYVASRISSLGGRGAAGSALRWGLFPLAVFLVCLPLLAMHGMLRAIAGMSLLVGNLCLLCFVLGLVIGLWKEARRYSGPVILDPTIALNKPVKKLFSVLLVAGILGMAPWTTALAGEMVLQDLTNVSIEFPAVARALAAFREQYAPTGIVCALLAFVSLCFSLAYDWLFGAVVEAFLTSLARRR